MLVWVSNATTLMGRPSSPPLALISSTAKVRTSAIGRPMDSRPPDKSYMLAMTMGSAADADLMTAGDRTETAAAPFTKDLRLIVMRHSSIDPEEILQFVCQR